MSDKEWNWDGRTYGNFAHIDHENVRTVRLTLDDRSDYVGSGIAGYSYAATDDGRSHFAVGDVVQLIETHAPLDAADAFNSSATVRLAPGWERAYVGEGPSWTQRAARVAWRLAVALVGTLAAAAVVACAAVLIAGCSATQIASERATVVQVVEVARSAAKAACRFAESPGAESLTTMAAGAVDPSTGAVVPLAFVAARLVCRIFVADPHADAVRVELLSDGHARPASAP